MCGDTDERKRIEKSKSVTEHYQWTCWLKIYAKKNGMGYWTGTGFILNVSTYEIQMMRQKGAVET